MSKLVEINFTVTGTGGIPLDEVSGTTLSGSILGTTPTLINPLPTMSNRPGYRFLVNNVQEAFKYDATVGEALKFSSLYLPTQKRSFVFWYYSHGSSHDASSANYMWGGDTNGFALHSDGIRFLRNSVSAYTAANGKNVGWHNVITTVDRVNSVYKCYFDGSMAYSGSTLPSLTYSGTAYPMSFGHSATTLESDMSLGYAATYDTVLDDTTVSGIYKDFIRDSAAGNEPLAVLSGVVLDINDTPASGVPVYIIKTSDHEIYHRTTTSSNGDYVLDVPFSGHYVAVTTMLPPNIGARAISLEATVTGTINYYDGS